MKLWSEIRRYVASSALVAAATALGAAARGSLAAPDLVMLYLLAIVVASIRHGRGPALVASGLSVLAYDFFFVPPFHTFAVADARNLLTFATMFVVALSISALTIRVEAQKRLALEREQRTGALYALSRDLANATDADEAARVVSAHASGVTGDTASIVLQPVDGETPRRDERGGGGWTLSLAVGSENVGTLRLEGGAPSSEQRKLLEAFAAQAALAIHRLRLADAARASELRARTEQMRSAVLSAVSHDLRTPLGAILGAATALRDSTHLLAPGQRDELVSTICEEAERLERLLVNLLEMTRLEAGALEVKREWVPLEELIGSALNRLDRQLEGRPVRIDVPDETPLAYVDPVSFGQVLLNLFDNVAKHTPRGTGVEVRAFADEQALILEISDHGPGLPPDHERRLFEKFFRHAPQGAAGAGLGLAICRGIVEAHGGTIRAWSRGGGGATFELRVPRVAGAPTWVEDLTDANEGPEAAT